MPGVTIDLRHIHELCTKCMSKCCLEDSYGPSAYFNAAEEWLRCRFLAEKTVVTVPNSK